MMAIKPPGSGAPGAKPIQKVDAPRDVKGSRAGDFKSDAAAPVSGDVTRVTGVDAAVKQVAADISAGSIQRGIDAVDAVIARMVEAQSGASSTGADVKSRIDELQLALGDDPIFSARVTRLIDAELDRLSA